MVVCKKKGKDEWLIGEEACRTALFNDGTTVDKLVKMIHDDKFATIEGVRYSAGELMRRYLEKLLLLPKEKYGTDEIAAWYLRFRLWMAGYRLSGSHGGRMWD